MTVTHSLHQERASLIGLKGEMIMITHLLHDQGENRSEHLKLSQKPQHYNSHPTESRDALDTS